MLSLISVKAAKKIILDRAAFRKVRKVSLDSVSNRALAQDIYARCDSPDFNKSMMDGFALRCDDAKVAPVVLKIIEHIPAGKIPRRALGKGECAKIATGAMLPKGSDAVAMKENTRISKDNNVEILKRVSKGRHIYRKGEFFKKGQLLLKKGSLLNRAAIGLFSSQGISWVKVFDAPHVAILSTGNEIVELGSKKKIGQVWNATAPMLMSSLRGMNVVAHYLGLVRDDAKLLLKKITQGLRYDILIITGAVSVGDFDLVPYVLKKAGATTIFHKVAIRPGKPFLFARHGRCLIFGLPGNPVSSLVSFVLFLKPAIRNMLGLKADFFVEEGYLAKDAYNDSSRLSFFPARLSLREGEYKIHPLRYGGSADLYALAKAEVLFMLDKNITFASKNSRIKFLRIRR